MKQIFIVGTLLGLLTACGPSAQKVKSTEEKIDSLISQLTIEEKVALIHSESSFASGGVKRLGIPHWVMSDGPHGVRKEHGTDYVPDEGVQDSVTYLPVGVALASTWNPELGYAYGEVLGSEANARGKDVILGPGINIIRTPVNGRNFEYLSEDPYLISKMVVGYIKGVQDQGISACVKHYAANNQETQRTLVDVYMSERALREIYLPGFKAAVQEGEVNTLMGAYNKFRGQYCTHNDYLINKVLKGEWGFKGVVMSDWGAVHSTMEAINNGTDVEMGTDLSLGTNPDYGKYFLGDTVVSLVNAGKVDVKLIDDKVRRILRVMYKTNMFGKRVTRSFNTKEHQATALKIAEEAIVLLKNENILPLEKSSLKKIAVIGANATRKHAGAGGSSQVNAKYEVTPLEAIQKFVGDKAVVTYAPGYDIAKDAKENPKLIQEAAKLAASADVVIYVGGWIHGFSDAWSDNCFDSEDTDKPNINLPFGQESLLKTVQKANAKNVVVLFGGAATDMTMWEKDAKAIVQAWYPGMEGGTALAKILFGETNPSGKLPMTFPRKLEDSPAHANGSYPGDKNNNWKTEYKEGIFVGYRYYERNKVTPAYPFGHGLSYTTFKFGNLSAKKVEGNVVVKVSVENTGKVAGAEVVQVYVSMDETKIERAPKELKGFKKVFLEPGEVKEVEVTLDQNAFQYFDETTMSWVTEKGHYFIAVGNSSWYTPIITDTTF